MCPSFMKTGKCKDAIARPQSAKTCKFAHNPIELSLIPVSTKIKNLSDVISVQQK